MSSLSNADSSVMLLVGELAPTSLLNKEFEEDFLAEMVFEDGMWGHP